MFTNSYANPFKTFQQMKMPEMNSEAMLQSYQKNLEAMCQAQQSLIDATSTINDMQTNFYRHAVEETSNFMKNFMNARTLEEKVHLQGEAIKGGVDKVMSHGREITEELTKTQQNISEHMGKSINENMNSAKDNMRAASGKR